MKTSCDVVYKNYVTGEYSCMVLEINGKHSIKSAQKKIKKMFSDDATPVVTRIECDGLVKSL